MEQEHFEVLLEEIRGSLQLLAEGHLALVARFDGVDARLDRMDARFDRMDARFDRIDQRFLGVEGELRRIADGFGDHEQRITKLEKRRR